MCHNNFLEPYLKIVEEPVEKFRFRYKSEMAGTHGSLNGMNSDRSRKQTFPTVVVNISSDMAMRIYDVKGFSCAILMAKRLFVVLYTNTTQRKTTDLTLIDL